MCNVILWCVHVTVLQWKDNVFCGSVVEMHFIVNHTKILIVAQQCSYCHWQLCKLYEGGSKRNKTSLTAAERGGVEEGQWQCLFPRPSTVSSETDVFL
jgi:hypothetical protein